MLRIIQYTKECREHENMFLTVGKWYLLLDHMTDQVEIIDDEYCSAFFDVKHFGDIIEKGEIVRVAGGATGKLSSIIHGSEEFNFAVDLGDGVFGYQSIEKIKDKKKQIPITISTEEYTGCTISYTADLNKSQIEDILEIMGVEDL